jgi:hypothetical protein
MQMAVVYKAALWIAPLALLAGCTQTTTRPRTALRSPGSYNSATALLFHAPSPKADVVVALPNEPGGKVQVTTVADGLFGKAPTRPIQPPPLPVETGIHVVTAPATQPAATQSTAGKAAATQPAGPQPTKSDTDK